MSTKLSFSLHEATTALDASIEQFLVREHGVTLSQFVFLANCSESEPTDVTKLARRMAVSKAAVSKRVPSLVSAGWVTTSQDPTNARRVVLSLTDEARALVDAAANDLEARLSRLFTDPRASEIDTVTLARHLTVITELLREKGSL